MSSSATSCRSVYSRLAPSGPSRPTNRTPRSSVGANSVGRARNASPATTTSASVAARTSQGRRIRLRSRRSYQSASRRKKPSTWAAKPERCSPALNILDAIAGVSVSAISEEKSTAAASVRPNSRNSRPIAPGRKEIGTNTDTSTSVVAITAKPISRLPSSAAIRGGWPSSMRLKMFSRTTIASSTTRPMASTMPSRVRTLTE